MGKYGVNTAGSVLSEDEREQLENGLIVLARIIARVYLKEKLLSERIDQEKVRESTGTTIVKTESDSPLVVSVQKAANLLGISRNATYEAVRIGEIPSIKIGRRVIIPRAALMKMLSG
ncbi:MAG: helix-turn-helix domain-containing protein [Dehalococcoidia bacterium]|jgi:excisionase family DNA binding protein